jgi:hypothetical protein
LTRETPARGTKRTCQNCAARYYDLGHETPVCPKCETPFVAAARAYPVRNSRRRPVATPVPIVPVAEAADEAGAVELVERDDEEADEEADDEAAASEDEPEPEAAAE